MSESIDDSGAPMPKRYVTLATACEMIPMPSRGALYAFLTKHPEIEVMYRRSSSGQGSHPRGFEQGFLTIEQIIQIQEMQFHDFEESRFVNAGRPAGSGRKKSILDTIMARASA